MQLGQRGRDVHADSQDTVVASIAGRRTYDLSIPGSTGHGPAIGVAIRPLAGVSGSATPASSRWPARTGRDPRREPVGDLGRVTLSGRRLRWRGVSGCLS